MKTTDKLPSTAEEPNSVIETEVKIMKTTNKLPLTAEEPNPVKVHYDELKNALIGPLPVFCLPAVDKKAAATNPEIAAT